MNNPTKETYTELQKAYDFFNHALFENKLPPCLITLQRKSRTYGYFSPNRFEHTQIGTLADEISMNPDHFKTESLPKILSTLVHEMVHLQQAYQGIPSRKGYHNKEWSNMMKAVGLISSHTGNPGGDRVGQSMSHYIEPGGRFENACQNLLESGFRLSWADKFGAQKSKKSIGRLKYTCSKCNLNVWAKPEVLLICGTCQLNLINQ